MPADTMFTYQFDTKIHTRLMQPADAETFYRLIDENRAYIGRWIPWAEGETLEARVQTIELTLNYPASGFCDVGIWCDETLAGVVGLHGLNPIIRSATFHYYLAEAYQGKGLITRTCRAMVDELFGSGDFNRLEINVVTANTRSMAIPARLGFQREGVFRQVYALHGMAYDLAKFAMLYEEWSK